MLIVSILLAFAGFAMLAIAMPRHLEQVLGRGFELRFRNGVRVAGWVLLALSVLPCFVGAGLSIAWTRWFGALTFAALPVALLLTYRPRLLKPFALAGGAAPKAGKASGA